jgi:ABC-type oligopeptide transport system ATPase subunit
VDAVRGVNLEIRPGETVALIGGSGSGKSTMARLLLGLESASAGRVEWHGRDISRLDRVSVRRFRQKVQIVFQDPFGSLNPRQPVGEMLREALRFHGLAVGEEGRRRVGELLELVGLSPRMSGRYPHEFSGGQRQRIAIARALSVEPELIVADEPVSALDVSVRAQILNLLMDLRETRGLSLLLIAHELPVVIHLADRTAVMSEGRVVESGLTRKLFENPAHSATRELLEAVLPFERPFT